MIGIYKIQNQSNGSVYIGQAVNIHDRFLSHKESLKRGLHENEHLQRAWNKYGESAFEFSVLEICERDKLTEREQYWIDFYGGINSKATYNQREAGSHGLHSEETKQKISKKQRGVHKKPGRKVSADGKKRLSLAHIGITPTEETRRKMSIAQTGRKHTEETKAKISNTNRQKYVDNPELREQVAERMRGRVFSEEHRRKIGDINRGKSYKDDVDRIRKHSIGLRNAYRTGKKKAVWITVDGVCKMQTEWANILNISYTSIIYQRKKGAGYVEQYIHDMLIKKAIKI